MTTGDASAARRTRPLRRVLLHGARVALFAAILVTIHLAERQRDAEARARDVTFEVAIEDVRRVLPDADSVTEIDPNSRTRDVLDAAGSRIGYVLQTSPDGDAAIGFSGPTNVLLGFDGEDRVTGVVVLGSGDTREHVESVVRDSEFLSSFTGRSWNELSVAANADGVSGATLTSLAMREAIARRLGGDRPLPVSLKFPDPPTVDRVRELFDTAAGLEADPEAVERWQVRDDDGNGLGTIVRTAFAAESIVGYQGPTETLIGLDTEDRVVGLVLGRSYDNEPYVGYVRDEFYYLDLAGRTLSEVSELDLEEEGIEGVSGATMTSMAVAEGVVATAQARVAADREPSAEVAVPHAAPAWRPSLRDIGTTLVVILGVIVGFTSLRGRTWARVPFQLVLIGYLGFVNGDLLSQALWVGWARHRVPWRTSTSLAVLSLAAIAVPIATRTNLYCAQLCPHGAAQQLLRNRLPWQWRIPPRVRTLLSAIPGVLLGWVVLVAVTGWAYSLVDVEPFDAYVPEVAGTATLVIAVVGLVVSLFVPMAYCRFGCPTGALLGYLRFNARSDRPSRRDLVAVACLGLAIGLLVLG